MYWWRRSFSLNYRKSKLILTEEQELVRKTARDFAIKYLEPGAIERDDKAKFPHQEVKMMGELGFVWGKSLLNVDKKITKLLKCKE